MLSMVRTPLSTRLLKGHDTNDVFGSSRMTSIDGSPSRTYFAAVEPPQPPPITTTRLPVFGAKSPRIAGAHAPSAPAATPSPVVRRNCLRVTLIPSLQCSEIGARVCHSQRDHRVTAV